MLSANGVTSTSPAVQSGNYLNVASSSRILPLCSHLPVRGILFLCHGCGHGGHQKCYQDFYRDQPPIDLAAPPKQFLATLYSRGEEGEEEDGSQAKHTSTRAHSRSESVDESRTDEDHHSEDGKSPVPRGRRRDIRRSASEVSDVHGHDTIPEKEVINYSGSALGLNHGGASVTGRKGANDKRSSSALKMDEGTTIEEDRGIPDEEYIIIRDKETEERETARAELQLFGHHCAAGCGHLCWMAKQ